MQFLVSRSSKAVLDVSGSNPLTASQQNKNTMKKFTINYWFNGKLKTWECIASDFPNAYKSFWLMIGKHKLPKKPTRMDSCYVVEKVDGTACRVPVQISNFTDEQLGII